MIRKITEIRNVGKFENYRASDVSLGRYCGIYSDNGQGKSTLTSIIRSLSENNPKTIIGRRTIGSTGDIVCKIETDNGFRNFKNDSWDVSAANALVFDAQFVNQNIYSGMHVGIDHRRRLYQFIIGEAAIHLNAEVNTIADLISDVTAKIGAKKTELNGKIGRDIALEDFLVLTKVENIDGTIAAKEKEVKGLSDKDRILRKSKLERIAFPVISFEKTKVILSKTIQDISKSSEERVKAHVHQKLGANGEDWIKIGVLYKGALKDCPFCGSDTTKSDLVAAYGDYFNDAYNSFKESIEAHKKSFDALFDLVLSERIKKTLSDNDQLVEFWNQYVPVSLLVEDQQQGDFFPIISSSDSVEFHKSFCVPTSQLLHEKSIAPLEISKDGINLDLAEKAFTKFEEQIDAYNRLVEAQNAIIQSHKDSLGTSDLDTERKSILRLQLSKIRFNEETAPLCEDYLKLVEEKNLLLEKKEAARTKLDEETQKIPGQYQDRINYYLERFGAEFRIVDHKKVNPSGQAATEYKLMLKGIEITLGDNKTPEDVASFQNTLSEGDKNTLAFSYFLARLDSEKDLASKVLVFDDPISSLDRFRRTWTRNILRSIGSKAKQLVVLSHDPGFLEELAHSLRGSDFKCLAISWDPERASSVIVSTTADDLNKNDHIRNIEKVRNYIKAKTGNPEDVKARLRHLCEQHLRKKFPRSFFRKDNLGHMLGIIRDAGASDDVVEEKTNLTDLEAINDFSIEENHSQDGTAGRIDEVELMTDCKLTFTLIEEPIP